MPTLRIGRFRISFANAFMALPLCSTTTSFASPAVSTTTLRPVSTMWLTPSAMLWPTLRAISPFFITSPFARFTQQRPCLAATHPDLAGDRVVEATRFDDRPAVVLDLVGHRRRPARLAHARAEQRHVVAVEVADVDLGRAIGDCRDVIEVQVVDHDLDVDLDVVGELRWSVRHRTRDLSNLECAGSPVGLLGQHLVDKCA